MASTVAQTFRSRREATVRAHVSAENAHQVGATVATFRSPRYEVVPFGASYDGMQAVADLLSELMAGFPDFHAEILALYHADSAVITEVRMTGTHNGPWAGLQPTGRRMDVQIACIFEFDGDDLICERVYFDFATVLRQLGASS